MTNEQLHSDCEKFCEYLRANGVIIYAMGISAKTASKNPSSLSVGLAEEQTQLALQMIANPIGLKVGWKP